MIKTLRDFPGLVPLFLYLSFFIINGCQREIQDPGGNTNLSVNNGVPVDDNIIVSASVRGIVIDENDRPVEGALIASGTNSTTTDRYGTFRFNNINLSKANGYVKVTKAGYFTGTRTFIVTPGRTHNVRIKLLPKTNEGNFNSSAGGTIQITGGGKLMIPGNAIADAGGNAYSGPVNVAMTWIDPTSNELPYIIPGDLRGITTNNEERGLQTFGMLGVELTGNSGQTLKIAAGRTAELSFPIPAILQAAAPATIDLWHFDETTGRWKQEGTATRIGNNYIAQVNHFSFWNCDVAFPLVNLNLTLVHSVKNIPLNNVQVRIKRPNGSYSYGRTDSIGNLYGKVPKGELLVLEVLGQCDNAVYTRNIGPFNNEANPGTIKATIALSDILNIKGTLVNCNNANVASGAVMVYTENSNSYSVPVTNGEFSLTLLQCNGAPMNFSVLGVDNATLQVGNPVSATGTTGTVDLGNIQACGTNAAQFIDLMIDGSPYTFAAPPDNIVCSDSLTSGSNIVSIYGFRNVGVNTHHCLFNFISNGSTGPQPLQGLSVFPGTLGYSETILTPNPVVNITMFGPPHSGFIEGDFILQMDFSGTSRNVTGRFRVRRN